jgi:hypothetical protein
MAVAIAGAGLGWSALAAAPLLALAVPAVPAALLATLLPILPSLVALGIARGALPFPAPRIPCANIEATRGPAPTRWLVAHCDSKAQSLSLAARVLGTALAITGGGGLVVMGLLRVLGPLPWGVVLGGVAAAVAGGGMLSRGSLTDESPGAVDNATGVVAALAAAESLRHDDRVGVLITDAEELGMEGARAWVATRGAVDAFINFDGLDDRGRVWVTAHGAHGRPLREALTRELDAAGYGAARPLPFAIPVDGVVLGRAGHAGVTLSRGDVGTARIIHTRHDSAARVSLATAIDVGRAAARVWSSALVDG